MKAMLTFFDFQMRQENHRQNSWLSSALAELNRAAMMMWNGERYSIAPTVLVADCGSSATDDLEFIHSIFEMSSGCDAPKMLEHV
jgi:hypothetical protein